MSFGWLENLEDVRFTPSADLSKHTTLKLKVSGDLAEVASLEALKEIILRLNREKIPYRLLGWGANQVLSGKKSGLYIKLKLPFDRSLLSEVREKYDLPASAPLNALQGHAQKHGLVGWEVFTGIPASLGGALYMNAGTALGEIGSLVESVKIMTPQGEIREHQVDGNSFVYRGNSFVKEGEVIVSAVLKNIGQDPKIASKIKSYMEYRKNSQPLKSFNCGCVWKNLDAWRKAGLFVDKCGLSNLAIGELSVSDKHANFFENKGGASFDDFQELTELLNDQLELHAGIRFELEAKVY